jgi:hypothetical protein
MTTWAPISGTFPHFGMQSKKYDRNTKINLLCIAARWVDPALGFAVGWVSITSEKGANSI